MEILQQALPPEKKQIGGRKTKYQFHDIPIGGAMDTGIPFTKAKQASIASAARQWAKRHNIVATFVTRSVDGILFIYRTS